MNYVVAREVFYVSSFDRYAIYDGLLGCNVNAGYLIGKKFYLYAMGKESYRCIDESSRFYKDPNVNLIDVGFLENPKYCSDVIFCHDCKKWAPGVQKYDCKVDFTCTLKGLVEIQDVRDYTCEENLETAVKLFLEENKKVSEEYFELEDYIDYQRGINKQRARQRIKKESPNAK